MVMIYTLLFLPLLSFG